MKSEKKAQLNKDLTGKKKFIEVSKKKFHTKESFSSVEGLSNIQLKNKFHRLLTLIFDLNKALKNNQPIILKKYAKNKQISLRTIQRDINFLYKTGYPIQKNHQGYFLEKPLEIVSLDYIENALLNLTTELTKHFDKDFIAPLRKERYQIGYTNADTPMYIKLPRMNPIHISFKGIHLNNLIHSITNKRRILIDYCPSKEYATNPKILKNISFAPLKICFYEGFWYLVGFCNDYQLQIQKYRLDLIQKMTLSEEYFSYDGDINEILEKSSNMWFETDRPDNIITLYIEKEVAKYFEKKNYFNNQKIIKREKNGALWLNCTASSEVEIFPTIRFWMPYIKIKKPKKLEESLIKQINNYLKDIKAR